MNNLDPKFTPNRHWFEIWTIENNGNLLSCVNFYDMAWKDSPNWAVQCYSQETSRTADAYYAVVHARQSDNSGIAREIIPLPFEEPSKRVAKLTKYREAVQ
jgi:hypothetical protein